MQHHPSMDIPTRYDFAATEARIYDLWLERHAFDSVYDTEGKPRDPAEVDKPRFVIVIPPPNVTGRLHMGHALNNTIQDVLIRYKRMDGWDALWVPGMDHAGISTQTVVRKHLDADGIDYRELGRDKFIERVWEWKAKYGGVILEQLKRMGCSCDWRRTRFTMDDGLNRAVRVVFKRLYDRGLLYRGKRIVNWCPVDQTALSDDEVSTKDGGEPGHLWHIRYPLVEPVGDLDYLTVATTRPETLFGDVAVAVHPEDDRYKDVVGKKIRVPLQDRVVPVIADDYVERDFGTGCLKITPAHDANDFEVGERHGLEPVNVMHPDATMNDVVPAAFQGLDRYKARAAAVAALEEQGLVDKVEDRMVPVGRAQRSGAVIEDRLSDQCDLIVRLREAGHLAPEAVETLRHRVALYEHVRSEAVYLRFLERATSLPKPEVAKLIAELEGHTYRRRLGDVLVRRGKLTREQDQALIKRSQAWIGREDEKILRRYRQDKFAGVGRPLIPRSKLEPSDFKISTLFRSRETRALMKAVEIEAASDRFPAMQPVPDPEETAAPPNPTPEAQPPIPTPTGTVVLEPRTPPPLQSPEIKRTKQLSVPIPPIDRTIALDPLAHAANEPAPPPPEIDRTIAFDGPGPGAPAQPQIDVTIAFDGPGPVPSAPPPGIRGGASELASEHGSGKLDRTIAFDGPGPGPPPAAPPPQIDLTIAVDGPQAPVPAQATGEATLAGGALGPSALTDVSQLDSVQWIGRFKVVELLGRGGMGAVFLAQPEGAGELLAIKVLLGRAANPLERARFQREIDLSKSIRHPRIVDVIESGETPEGLSYLVVPALAGQEVRALLDEKKQGISQRRALTIVRQVLEGLTEIHKHDVVHRDIKPENVFVLAGRELAIKIMDFGLAKRGDDAIGEDNCALTAAGEVVGSPAYMAPESITSDEIDDRTDLYSLGVLLFEMLTGQLPIEAETPRGFLTAHLVAPPLTLAEARPEVEWSPDLEELIAELLAKKREGRPASAKAVLERLDALDGKEVEAAGETTRSGWGFRGLLGRLLGKQS